MVLDPLSAISLAGNIVQFVDFSTKVLRQGYVLYNSANGATAVNEELELLTTDFLKLSTKLQRPFEHSQSDVRSARHEQELEGLCTECAKVAKELLHRLESLKVQGTRTVWKSLWQALQTAWTEDEIRSLVARLGAFKSTLETHVLVGLRENLDLVAVRMSQRFTDLDEKTQQIITALLNNQSSFVKDFHEQTMAIAQMLSRTEITIIDQHEKTRAIIIDALRDTGHAPMTNSEYEEHAVDKKRMEERDLRLNVERRLLQQLAFPNMTDRIEEVAEAHARTYEWIFSDSSSICPSRTWSNFVEWLKDGNGIYWINGKAASGKSTLMRYILRHPRTMELLTSWAQPLKVNSAAFFFWNSGTADQRSQIGFLRSLLYEVLHQHRELIPVILPWQWAREYFTLPRESNINPRTNPWTSKRLMQALNLLAREDIVPIKLFLLVDGLDEYDGDPEELANIFRGLTTLSKSNIKVCLSSRPLVAFKDAFSSSPGLRLQDLTQQDIKHYVSDKLTNHARFQQLFVREPRRAPALINEIVAKAEGVFLWVKLVVQSLLRGIGNRDGIADLQKRLSLLPSDLEDLYAHMLNRIDPFYKARGSEIFQLVRVQREEKRIIGPFIHVLNELLTILALALADSDASEWINCASSTSADRDIELLCMETEDRLSVRCAGLLEVQSHFTDEEQKDGYKEPMAWQAKVQYLHRTARDYVESPQIWATMLGYTSGTPFHPFTTLLRSGILQLQLLSLSQSVCDLGPIIGIAFYSLVLAHYVETQTRQHNADLLDQLDLSMASLVEQNFTLLSIEEQDHIRQPSSHWSNLGNQFDWDPSDYNSFLSLAAQFELNLYLAAKLRDNSEILKNKKGRPLLDYAVNPPREMRHCPISEETVATILQHGANPNENWRHQTVWERALNWQAEFGDRFLRDPEKTSLYMRSRAIIFTHMLLHGADREAFGKDRDDTEYSVSSLVNKFSRWAPVEAKKMQSLLESSSSKTVETKESQLLLESGSSKTRGSKQTIKVRFKSLFKTRSR